MKLSQVGGLLEMIADGISDPEVTAVDDNGYEWTVESISAPRVKGGPIKIRLRPKDWEKKNE